MAHKSNHAQLVVDKDSKHFIIDPITRTIKNETTKLTLIKNDHNSERFTFELPSEIEGHDMTKCNHVEVHFINVNGQNREKSMGMYPVDDFALMQTDPTKCTFSWLISNAVTTHAGTLNFAVRFACVNPDSAEVLYSWNTTIHTGIIIADSIYNSNVVVKSYVDILEQWWSKLQTQFTTLEASFEKRFEELEKQVLAKEPIGIESTAASGVTVDDTKTITNVTVIKTDGTTTSFDVEAQNGKDGEDGKDAQGLLGIELIDGILYTKTSDNSELEFSVNSNGELAVNF